jgi:Fe-Mn family superoxide dismutase
MTYELKTLSCDPSRLKGLPEKLIVSHYGNNHAWKPVGAAAVETQT